MPRATKLAKPAKKLATVIPEAPEPIVVFPPIKETEYRGQHRTSYSFAGPDGDIFSCKGCYRDYQWWLTVRKPGEHCVRPEQREAADFGE